MPVGKSDLKALAEFKPGSSGGAQNYLRPSPGTPLRIRICPPYTDEAPMLIDGRNVPFLGMRIHYFDQGEEGQGVSGVCPSVDGNRCLA